jgi:hypothetical protein
MRSRVTQFALMATGVVLALCSSSSPVLAAFAAPEVDASSFSAGLGLVAAGVLIIRSRRRR